MNEKDGCAVLRRCFTEAGPAIEDACSLEPLGIPITLDGFDPSRRIGYEYITTEAGDRAEVTPDILAALEERMERGDLFVLLIDEAETTGERTLVFAATHFLDALRARGVLS